MSGKIRREVSLFSGGGRSRTRSVTLILFSFLMLLFGAALFLTGKNDIPEAVTARDHGDYSLFFVRPLSRRLTSWKFVEPPILITGTETQKYKPGEETAELQPIPAGGEWQFSLVQINPKYPLYLPYFALTTSRGWHFRIGCRWDDLDHYYTFPSIALKHLRAYRH
ncbi:MAG: hypothetical protein PHX83_15555 [Acidobacteriia bacterium]|nr:hypothetical protein [Terriglobia bacterium]